MKINELDRMMESLGRSDRMPVLFLGHGSFMNAIEEDEFED
jgi:4,5-DOPA dioxygenase extradiol